MKTLTFIFLTLFSVTTATAQKEKVTVKFLTSIDCEHCVETVMKNIAFEKGVKDIKCDLETKRVDITYRKDKNDVKSLKRALEKLGFTAEQIKDDEKKKKKKKEEEEGLNKRFR